MILGLFFALLAGSLVSLQNIFNSKVNEHAGNWATTTLVLGLGFLASFAFGLIFQGIHLFNLQNMEPWYWFSGIIGVGVVTCLVQAIRLLGPTIAISIAILSQLGLALLWDSLGLLGFEKVPFTINQLIGVLVIGCGILVFKLGGKREKQAKLKVTLTSQTSIKG